MTEKLQHHQADGGRQQHERIGDCHRPAARVLRRERRGEKRHDGEPRHRQHGVAALSEGDHREGGEHGERQPAPPDRQGETDPLHEFASRILVGRRQGHRHDRDPAEQHLRLAGERFGDPGAVERKEEHGRGREHCEPEERTFTDTGIRAVGGEGRHREESDERRRGEDESAARRGPIANRRSRPERQDAGEQQRVPEPNVGGLAWKTQPSVGDLRDRPDRDAQEIGDRDGL